MLKILTKIITLTLSTNHDLERKESCSYSRYSSSWSHLHISIEYWMEICLWTGIGFLNSAFLVCCKNAKLRLHLLLLLKSSARILILCWFFIFWRFFFSSLFLPILCSILNWPDRASQSSSFRTSLNVLKRRQTFLNVVLCFLLS